MGWQEHEGRTSLVRTVWAAEVEHAGRYPVPGSEYWAISFIERVDGTLAGELDGPTLQASHVASVEGERYWGVELAPHVVVPGLSKQTLLGGTVGLPVIDGRVLLGDRWWPVPRHRDLEGWVESLSAAGGLLVDDEIGRALAGDRAGASTRTWQRRFRRTVGLTNGQVERLRRVQHAHVLLQEGVPPAVAAVEAGFSDQPHLTRSLREIRGMTPAAVIAAHARG